MSVLLPLILLLTFSPRVQQQQKSEMQSKLVKFHLVLLKKGPKWTPTATKETEQMHQAHVDHVLSLLGNRKAVVAGPLSDDGEIRGIYIFRTESADEATKWVNSDPAVASGNLIAEIHPWLSEDVFKKAATPQANDCVSCFSAAWRKVDAGADCRDRRVTKGALG